MKQLSWHFKIAALMGSGIQPVITARDPENQDMVKDRRTASIPRDPWIGYTLIIAAFTRYTSLTGEYCRPDFRVFYLLAWAVPASLILLSLYRLFIRRKSTLPTRAIMAGIITAAALSGEAAFASGEYGFILLPIAPHWIALAIPVLLTVNCLLLYNRFYLIADLAMLIFLGIFSITGAMENSNALSVKALIDCLMALLCLASIRALNRIVHMDMTGQAQKRMVPAALSLIVFAFWTALLLLPSPCLLPSCSVYQSDMKNLAKALELYRSDNSGSYPGSLTELTPEYLKALPEIAPPQNRRALQYYGRKYGFSTDFIYEVSKGPRYTLSCRAMRFGLNNGTVEYRCTPAKGLTSD